MAARWCVSRLETHEGCGRPSRSRSGGFGNGRRDHLSARPWISTWGATDVEATRTLPGDELVPNPTSTTTLAVTIDAPPKEVWAWLARMGADRGGFYTYLLVENTLLRLGIHNADRIHPEWQDIEVGDHFWFTPEDYPGPRQGPMIGRWRPKATGW